jgi:hypothetical protein
MVEVMAPRVRGRGIVDVGRRTNPQPMLEALARIGSGDPAPRDRGIRACGVMASTIVS